MKLSDFDAALINIFKLDADRSLKDVAHELGKSVSAVRAGLSRLEERKIISYYPFVNICTLGYSIFLFYFTPAAAQERTIIQHLQADDRVSWLAQFSGGATKYCASFICTSPYEYQQALSELGARHGATFQSSFSLVETSLSLFSNKYLAPRIKNYDALTWRDEGGITPLDTLDKRILTGLLQRRYTSVRDLSRQLKIAHSTVSERINNLKGNKVLQRFVYLPNPQMFGYSHYKVLLKTRTLHPQFKKELWKFVLSELHTTILLECIGVWDFEIGIEISKPIELEQFCARLQKQFGKLTEIVGTIKREDKLKERCYPFTTSVSS